MDFMDLNLKNQRPLAVAAGARGGRLPAAERGQPDRAGRDAGRQPVHPLHARRLRRHLPPAQPRQGRVEPARLVSGEHRSTSVPFLMPDSRVAKLF